MRIALLYPPPWKIPAEGADADPIDGPPEGYRQRDLDADFYQTPYGLFALGAAAMRAGHQVKVLNLSAFSWPVVEDVIARLDADLYGMSCWTANRRGVALVAKLLKAKRPNAHVVIGGPHATPLAERMLAHHPEIDTVCLGESDTTFMELVDRLGRGEGNIGLAGAKYRRDGKIEEGPPRPAIEDLDGLSSPHDWFDTHIFMTSRGCPWACTFCGAETTWGRGFRGNSVSYVLDAMEKVVARLPVKMIQIKDDTFTTNKKRVLELCAGMRARKLQFFWSCDTRVDLLTEPLLKEMRLAGCERLSLGVESGSQRILDAIDKKITVAEIEKTTALAKKLGIRVRFYMMLGNRGETKETFVETQAFLARARPHQYIFSCLSIYPGTRDFDEAAKDWLDPEIFFRERFQELKTPFDASPETTEFLNAWFFANHGLQHLHEDGVPEYAAILERLGDYHAAHMDLGGAYFRAGDLDRAEQHVRRAQKLGYPLPGLVHNYLACIAKERGNLDAMMDELSTAAKVDPQHWVLIKNVQAARAWFKAEGPAKGLPLVLEGRHDFQLLEKTMQPTLPGPLPDDFATWSTTPSVPRPSPAYVKTPELEGSQRQLRTRLRISR